MAEVAAEVATETTIPGTEGTPAVEKTVGGDGWNAGFNEDTNTFVEGKGWTDANSVIESYKNLEKLQGGSKKVIAALNDESTPDDINNFYNSLGRPEKAEGYTFKMAEGGDEDFHKWFADTMHSNGLSDSQATKVFEAMTDQVLKIGEADDDEVVANNDEAIAALKKHYGESYDDNIASAQNVVSKLGYTEAELAGLEKQMGTATMVDLFARIGSGLGETGFKAPSTNGGVNGFAGTPDQALNEIETLKNNEPFMKRYKEGDTDAIAKWTRLFKQAYN